MTRRLLYFGTDEEVREGDRIEYTTFLLRRKVLGTVTYIPEKTALELDKEKKPPDDWLIRFDDGTDAGWMYHPEELQPKKRLRLISRGADYERLTPEDLERQEAELEERLGWRDDLLGCGFLIAVGLAILAAIAILKYGLPW